MNAKGAGGAEARVDVRQIHLKPSLRARIDADAQHRHITLDRWIEEVASLYLDDLAARTGGCPHDRRPVA